MIPYFCLKLSTQESQAIVPPSTTLTEAGCASPARLWAQRKTTVRIGHLSEIRHWKQCLPISQTSLLFCQYVCLTLDQNMHSLENWYPITLLTAPVTHQRWSLITKLSSCQKMWLLIFCDRRVLQGLDCKISWSKVCSYWGVNIRLSLKNQLLIILINFIFLLFL